MWVFVLFEAVWDLDALSHQPTTQEDSYMKRITAALNAYSIASTIFKVIIWALIGHQVWIEIRQMLFHKALYFRSFWNLIDFFAIAAVIVVLIMDFFQVDPQETRPVIAMMFLCQYAKFFYFLRIFDKSAPLVRAIIQIVVDCLQFLIIFSLGVVCFAVIFWILSMNNDRANSSLFHIPNFTDAVIYSYLLALGEFNTDEFDDSSAPFLLWAMFLLATAFSMIILLNMLIAIMGESFTKI